jgi:hypothetical protein
MSIHILITPEGQPLSTNFLGCPGLNYMSDYG